MNNETKTMKKKNSTSKQNIYQIAKQNTNLWPNPSFARTAVSNQSSTTFPLPW